MARRYLTITCLLLAFGLTACFGGGEPEAPETAEPPPADEQAAEQEPGQPPQEGDAATPPGEAEAAPPQDAAAAAAGDQVAEAKETTAEEPPPQAEAPPPPESGGERIPYEEAFPEDFKQVRPVRIAVLSSPNRPAAGAQVAMILGQFQRSHLERKLGRPIRIAYVSRSSKRHKRKTQIRYRPDYLKAALRVARAIPHEQVVEPMSPAELLQKEVDVFIYIGESVR
jgi:hypothetical protein